jgi:hypothetical protein
MTLDNEIFMFNICYLSDIKGKQFLKQENIMRRKPKLFYK